MTHIQTYTPTTAKVRVRAITQANLGRARARAKAIVERAARAIVGGRVRRKRAARAARAAMVTRPNQTVIVDGMGPPLPPPQGRGGRPTALALPTPQGEVQKL